MAQQQFITQPPFDKRITTRAFPLNGGPGGQFLQTGYMIWDKPLPGYGSNRAVIRYLYNPSTVSADYSMSDASAQAALNFPNPGDTAQLAIPISQTAQWALMFDRTFEVWQSYESTGLPTSGNGSINAGTLGVQADVMAFMQFTGMFYNGGNIPSGANGSQNLAANAGIMMQWPAWAFFGNNNVANGLMYYGYINEWSVQYTHWTQFNVPMRCVVNVNWTMLSMPSTKPPSLVGAQVPGTGIALTPDGSAPASQFPFTVGTTVPVTNTTTGIGGR
jgi:hypothetical protein